MDSQNKNNSDEAIDIILQQLKKSNSGTGRSASRKVDDILASIGIEDDQLGSFNSNSADFRASSTSGQELTHEEKVARSTAVFQAITKQDIENAKQNKSQLKQEGHSKKIVAEEKPKANFGKSLEELDNQDKQLQNIQKKYKESTTILDVKVEHGEKFSRMGKAGAIEKVDPEKFTKEKEFLSWFGGKAEEVTGLSKKEQRKLKKEKKKNKQLEYEESQEETFSTEPYLEENFFDFEMEESDVFTPKENSIEEPDRVEQEEIEKEKRKISKQVKAQDNVITGSAFDEAEKDWPVEGSLFDHEQEVEYAAKTAKPKLNTKREPQFFDIEHSNGEFHRVSAEKEEPEKDQYVEEAEQSRKKETNKTVKSLYVDEMVDNRFRDFFSETVSVDREESALDKMPKFKFPKKKKTALLTGEFSKLAVEAEETYLNRQEDEDFIDYNHVQEAPEIENDIASLKRTLLIRTLVSGVIAIVLFILSAGFAGAIALPALISPMENGVIFGIIYLLLLIAAIILNFTTISAGITGLFGAPSSDTAPALAAFGALLQAVVLFVHLAVGGLLNFTLFAGLAVLLFAANNLGKYIRAGAIYDNFQLVSSQATHSAGFIIDDGRDVSYYITEGMQETEPTILLSRPTSLVKGFMRQSFSQRWSDRLGKKIGVILLGVSVLAALISFVQSKEIYMAISSFAAALCIAAPLSSTLLAAIPTWILQKSTSKVGAVVAGWSAIEELGEVNVVMVEEKDVFPSTSIKLSGIKTFGKMRIDVALLYAASLAIREIDTMKEIFMKVIQGKSDMLYDVDSVTYEAGKGYIAWINNCRVVLGTRAMLQRHGIEPPPIDVELEAVPDDSVPMYLAISGKLAAMFVLTYTADEQVQETLEGLIKSGISMMVTSSDMNITGNMIEVIYNLPSETVKVMKERELEVIAPLTEYLPESEGVMTHAGTFASFIGGMRAAAGCASAERMAGIVQAIAAGFAALICILLAISGGLAGFSLFVMVIYQIAWTLIVTCIPFARRY